VVTGTTRGAAVGLEQATLRVSDVPAGFTAPVTKIYHHMARQMEAGDSTCVTTTRAGGITGWKEGVIQAFKSRDPLSGLTVCAYLITPARNARTYYTYAVQGYTAGGVAKRIAIKGKIGDESYAGWDDANDIAGQKIRVYRLFFRHGTVVIALEIDKPPKGFNSGVLVHLGTLLNARLK
jgi:hypothetical protein